MHINRRNFFRKGVSGTAGLLIGNQLKAITGTKGIEEETSANQGKYDLMKEVMKYRKIDAHAHVFFSDESARQQLDFGERLGIEKQVVSNALNGKLGTVEEVRDYNDLTIKAIKEHPDHFLGSLVLNATYQKESLEEIDRCTDAGMIAAGEFYTQVKINDPLFFPIIEKLIDLKMIIMCHGECQLGVGGYRMKHDSHSPPNTSIPEDFVEIAKRYPEGIFLFAHIGAGFDWEYECKLFQDIPNIYVDTSGSNNAENMIDFALEHLGEDRLVFAADNSYYQGVGKILASNLTETQKKKVFFDNYNNLLKIGGRHVD